MLPWSVCGSNKLHCIMCLSASLSHISLIDWISDTCPQRCTDLQSPVKCLHHSYRGRYSMQSYMAEISCLTESHLHTELSSTEMPETCEHWTRAASSLHMCSKAWRSNSNEESFKATNCLIWHSFHLSCLGKCIVTQSCQEVWTNKLHSMTKGLQHSRAYCTYVNAWQVPFYRWIPAQ